MDIMYIIPKPLRLLYVIFLKCPTAAQDNCDVFLSEAKYFVYFHSDW